MQRQRPLLPTGRKWVKLAPGGVITGFAVSHELNYGHGYGEKQKHMNVTALMQEEFEDEPNQQE
jgi:hypothetical protein